MHFEIKWIFPIIVSLTLAVFLFACSESDSPTKEEPPDDTKNPYSLFPTPPVLDYACVLPDVIPPDRPNELLFAVLAKDDNGPEDIASVTVDLSAFGSGEHALHKTNCGSESVYGIYTLPMILFNPLAEGEYDFLFNVTDIKGYTDGQVFRLTVTAMPEDEVQIRRLIRKYEDAMARRDAHAVGQCFVERTEAGLKPKDFEDYVILQFKDTRYYLLWHTNVKIIIENTNAKALMKTKRYLWSYLPLHRDDPWQVWTEHNEEYPSTFRFSKEKGKWKILFDNFETRLLVD